MDAVIAFAPNDVILEKVSGLLQQIEELRFQVHTSSLQNWITALQRREEICFQRMEMSKQNVDEGLTVGESNSLAPDKTKNYTLEVSEECNHF